MKSNLPFLRILPGLLILSLLLTGCFGAAPATPTVDAGAQNLDITPLPMDAGTVAPLETVAALPSAISLSLGTEFATAGAPLPVDVYLLKSQPLSDISVEVAIPLDFFQVLDDNPDAEGFQADISTIPAGAMVDLNEITPEGILRYHITGLAANADAQVHLLTLHLLPLQSGSTELAVQPTTAAIDTAGAPTALEFYPFFIDIQPAAEPTLLPLDTLTPEPVIDPGTPAPVGTLAPGIYIRLQTGQTVQQFAQTFGSTPEQIAAANNFIDPNQIPVGTLLYIPVQSPAGQAAYFISPRDTLYSIARTFNMTVEVLAAQNNIPLPYNTIKAGNWLILIP